jgi:hypothetical protein
LDDLTGVNVHHSEQPLDVPLSYDGGPVGDSHEVEKETDPGDKVWGSAGEVLEKVHFRFEGQKFFGV